MHRDTSDLPPSVLGIGVTYWKRAAAILDINVTAPGNFESGSPVAECSAIIKCPNSDQRIAVFVLDDESSVTESLVERCFAACKAAGMRCSVMILRDRESLHEAQDALQDWGIVPKARL
ncbi:MAG: hypothetical protein ACK5ZG_15945 [Phycisphaerae bacterium]|jgi:hypothetical protein